MASRPAIVNNHQRMSRTLEIKPATECTPKIENDIYSLSKRPHVLSCVQLGLTNT